MKKFFKTVAFVTVFSVCEKCLGFLYRIYLSRSIGAEGVGLYQVSLFSEDLFAESDDEKPTVRDEYGRIFRGEHLLCSVNGGELTFLPKIYNYSPEELGRLRIKILF